MEDELKKQIKEAEKKLQKELQKCNNVTSREMKENELPDNTAVLVSQKKSTKTTFDLIQKVSNTITDRRVETEPNQEGNTEQMRSKTTQEMSEEEMKLAMQNDQSNYMHSILI